jgi:hypothetical protein
LIFDVIGLAISGYGFLLVYQIIATLANANAFIILMGFFVGIKVVVLSLYDLNRNMLHKNIPFLGALISVVGNGIIFGLCMFLIPEVPLTFFIGLAIVDFLMVTLCHLLWWLLIGKDGETGGRETESSAKLEPGDNKKKPATEKPAPKEKKLDKEKKIARNRKSEKEKKTWLNQDDEEGSEYDSIFTSLLENEKKSQQSYREPEKTNAFEEKRYQTSDFLNEIKANLKNEQRTPSQESQTRVIPIPQSPDQRPRLAETGRPDELSGKKKELNSFVQPSEQKESEAQQLKHETIKPALDATAPIARINENNLFADLPSVPVREETVVAKDEHRSGQTAGMNEPTQESEEDILMIERRLGYLISEIEKSMKETQFLQNAIGNFQKEVETYAPISGDEKIVATGNLIREKLKTIIDKQFVVDEVLDDLIRLSKLINKRINDLDIIEAGLNQRKIALDQKDLLFVEEHDRNEDATAIEIMPEEVVMKDQDSEIIVAEGDYETIRKYLNQNK